VPGAGTGKVRVIEGADILPGPLFWTEGRGDRAREVFIRLHHFNHAPGPEAGAPLKYKDLPSAAVHERPIVEGGALKGKSRCIHAGWGNGAGAVVGRPDEMLHARAVANEDPSGEQIEDRASQGCGTSSSPG